MVAERENFEPSSHFTLLDQQKILTVPVIPLIDAQQERPLFAQGYAIGDPRTVQLWLEREDNKTCLFAPGVSEVTMIADVRDCPVDRFGHEVFQIDTSDWYGYYTHMQVDSSGMIHVWEKPNRESQLSTIDLRKLTERGRLMTTGKKELEDFFQTEAVVTQTSTSFPRSRFQYGMAVQNADHMTDIQITHEGNLIITGSNLAVTLVAKRVILGNLPGAIAFLIDDPAALCRVIVTDNGEIEFKQLARSPRSVVLSPVVLQKTDRAPVAVSRESQDLLVGTREMKISNFDPKHFVGIEITEILGEPEVKTRDRDGLLIYNFWAKGRFSYAYGSLTRHNQFTDTYHCFCFGTTAQLLRERIEMAKQEGRNDLYIEAKGAADIWRALAKNGQTVPTSIYIKRIKTKQRSFGVLHRE